MQIDAVRETRPADRPKKNRRSCGSHRSRARRKRVGSDDILRSHRRDSRRTHFLSPKALLLFVYLPSHSSHYLLMLWRGCRYYGDWRPKIVSAHPLLSLWRCFLPLPPSRTHPSHSPPLQTSAVLLTLLWDAIPEGRALSLPLSITLPFSSLHPISPCKYCVQIHFIGSLCFHGNILKPWKLFKPSQTLFQNCCIQSPPPSLSLSLSLCSSSQPVNVYA